MSLDFDTVKSELMKLDIGYVQHLVISTHGDRGAFQKELVAEYPFFADDQAFMYLCNMLMQFWEYRASLILREELGEMLKDLSAMKYEIVPKDVDKLHIMHKALEEMAIGFIDIAMEKAGLNVTDVKDTIRKIKHNNILLMMAKHGSDMEMFKKELTTISPVFANDSAMELLVYNVALELCKELLNE